MPKWLRQLVSVRFLVGIALFYVAWTYVLPPNGDDMRKLYGLILGATAWQIMHNLKDPDDHPEEVTGDAFSRGDVVMLRSGGPSMTVTKEPDGSRTWCEWFDRDHVPQGQHFDVAALRKTEESGSNVVAGALPRQDWPWSGR